ncbi:hypothetical protein OC861_000768 [Tilletia horrida]|nr:hypothetical protein OC861_000768 [Tilletia horrida]
MLNRFRSPKIGGSSRLGAGSPTSELPGLVGPTSPPSERGSDQGALDHYDFDMPSPHSMGTPGAPASIAESGVSSWINEMDAYRVMARHLYEQARAKQFFSADPEIPSAATLRMAKGAYVCHPAENPRLETFSKAVAAINCEVCVCVSSPVVVAITSRLAWGTTEVPIKPAEHIQVVETMEDAALARKAQYAAFVRQECALLVWSDSVDNIIDRIQSLENKMVSFVWRSATASKIGGAITHPTLRSFNTQQSLALSGSSPNSSPASDAQHLSGSPAAEVRPPSVARGPSPIMLDLEKASMAQRDGTLVEERPTMLQGPVMQGLRVGLCTLLCGLMLRSLVAESLLDQNYMRFAIAAVIPLQFIVTLFFSGSIIYTLFMFFAPINQMSANTRYFSGQAPQRITTRLPHITVQMPVYKEDLEEVIRPTVASLQKAISTYCLQGGSAAIVVSDDGMQLISDKERAVRQEFYDVQNISWVARPGHNVNGFTRNGRFKKASNLNVTLQLSMAIDRMMEEMRPKDAEALDRWTEREEQQLYSECLARAIPSIHPGIQASGNIRMGELILLIDSDTRVPADCFIDAASEMSQCPDVGIIQHYSGVMIVTGNMFEKGIAFFTRLVNFAITYTIACGDIAPFVGHNAFLRWSAMQEAAFVDPMDGIKKIWSESHVSEDFDMALRLLMKGYCVRWATYSKGEFQEGVSLTAEDELNRWQKYAFGVSELIFHPFKQWLFKGPFTPLFRKFIGSKALPLHYKIAACAYMFSYYAIASAMPLTFALCLVQGWFYPILDLSFLPPFQVWISVAIVFGVASPIAMVIARFRSKQDGFFDALLEHLIWTPFLVIFFTGLSMHVLFALIAHPLGINMTWGATLKSLGKSNFFNEIPGLFKRFWPVLTISSAWIVAVVILGTPLVPLEWQISGFFTIWPSIWICVMHIIYPFALNPALLRFSF